MGIITSLGQGKSDNWGALTRGVSGIPRISRFSTAGLRTTIAGTIDFVPVEEISAPALSERLAELVIEEALARPRLAGSAIFPVRCFWHCRRWKWNGPSALRWPPAAQQTGAGQTVTYKDLLRAAGGGSFEPVYRRFMFSSVGENLAARFGTKGSPIATSTACASGGTAIQLGVEAIRRGETEAALVVGTDASVKLRA